MTLASETVSTSGIKKEALIGSLRTLGLGSPSTSDLRSHRPLGCPVSVLYLSLSPTQRTKLEVLSCLSPISQKTWPTWSKKSPGSMVEDPIDFYNDALTNVPTVARMYGASPPVSYSDQSDEESDFDTVS